MAAGSAASAAANASSQTSSLAAGAAGAGFSALTGGIQAGLSISEGKKSRKFQKKVLKNQIQWRVADLKAAGLNPILAAAGGLGGGGAPGGVLAQIPKLGDSNAAATSAKVGLEATKNKTLIRAADAQADASSAQALLSQAAARTQESQTHLNANNAQNAALQHDIMKLSLPQLQFKSNLYLDPRFQKIQFNRELVGGSFGAQAVGGLGILKHGIDEGVRTGSKGISSFKRWFQNQSFRRKNRKLIDKMSRGLPK